ncbi:MAG TPA: rod shape-determining protein MreD [Gemmatimonadales bacterium]
MRRSIDYGLLTVVALLIVLHFALRPWLGSPRAAPDFLLLALLVYAIQARPGAAAIAGFVVGILSDALTPVAFGSGMLAYTVVGYLAAWGKAIFFAENLVVMAGFFFAGTVVRDVLVLLWGGQVTGGALLWQLGVWTLLKGLTTAVVGVGALLVFRNWLHVRLRE